MGTTLTGTQINNTYDGLIKTTDNTAITATTKLISDGLGNDTCIKVGTAGTDFLGNVDFSAATVTGLPSGAAGLVSGTGTDSMKNADSLVTTPAIACGNYSIALGEQAEALGTQSTSAIVIGCSAQVGHATLCNHDGSIAIGKQSVIGSGAQDATNSIAIGTLATVFDPNSIAIGCAASSAIPDSVAIGTGVAAQVTGHVTVKALNTCVASTPSAGGILMEDAGGTARRLNITAAGALQIDSTPVGGGGAAGLVNGTGTDSLKNADSLVTTPAVAACPGSIALGNGATANPAFGTEGSIAIGCNSSTPRGQSVLLGGNTCVTDAGGIAIGYTACVNNLGGIAVGFGTLANSRAVAIGCIARATATDAIAIGCDAQASVSNSIIIGKGGRAGFGRTLAVGTNVASSTSNEGTVIGNSACGNAFNVTVVGDGAIGNVSGATVLGNRSTVTATCGVALGFDVDATRADTTVSRQYEACVAGKGIVVTSPDGLTTLGIGIDNSGNIVTYTP